MKYIEWIQRPGFPGHFFALLMGASLPFSLAPYYIWPISIISIAGLFFSIKQLPSRSAMWRGWWFGFGAYAVGVSWVYISIHVHSFTPAVPAVLMTLGFVAGLAWFFALLTGTYQRWFQHLPHAWLSFAALWALAEWFRSWFLSGFPWLFIGDGYIDSPLAGWAPVLGVYGLSFIVAASAAWIANVLSEKQRPAGLGLTLALSVLAVPWASGWALQHIQWTQPISDQPLSVAAIQGNIAQDRKWLPEEIYPTLEKYRSASEGTWDADLILWPETAITVLYHQGKEYLGFLDEQALSHQTTLITGIPYQQGAEEPYPGAYHNSILALGSGAGIYHKQKLVPFGEYMPLPESWRPLLAFFNIPMSEFRTGEAQQPLLHATVDETDYRIAPFICYEVVYPDFVADMAKESGIMVTISNDAWFGRSIGPLQHLGSARMRALENGRYLLRATNTGVTALIDAKGKIIQAIPQFEFGVLKAQAQVMQGLTPFTRWGSWPIILLSLGILILIRLKTREVGSSAKECL